MNNHVARPGYYILFDVYQPEKDENEEVIIQRYRDAYYVGGEWRQEYALNVLNLIATNDDHYSIAWCPSRNQAQKSAIKNWSNE